jgi:hypothetical protein
MAVAGLSAGLIAVTQSIRMALSGGFGMVDLGLGLLPPLVLLGALALMNIAFWGTSPAAYRMLAVTALCALAAIPAMVALGHDNELTSYVESRLGALLAPLKAQASAQSSYDASALLASLDVKALTAASMEALASSYAAFLLVLVGGSWWLGNRASGPESRGRSMAPALAEYRVPYVLVWPFLACWALVLAAIYLNAPSAAKAAAWNCALVLSLIYAAQGLGIVSHLLKRWNTPRSLRIVLAATALLALVTQTTGLAVAVSLPVLGVTEVWIPYRKPKGVGA